MKLNKAILQCTVLSLMLLNIPHIALANTMSVDDVSKKSIADYLGIRVLKLESDEKFQEIKLSEAPYDTHLLLNASYARDEKPNSSIFAATRSDQWLVEGGIGKKTTLGTEFDLKWSSDRDETNTTFVSINPAYTEKAELSWRQPLASNFFGRIDRLALEQVKVNVERFNFDVLQRMESAVWDVRQLYWSAWTKKELVGIESIGLKDAQTFLISTKEKMSLGLLEDPDLYAAQSNVLIRQIEFMVAKKDAIIAVNQLKTALSMALTELLEIESAPQIEAPIEYDIPKTTTAALDRRFDYKHALLKIKEMGIELKITKYTELPQIDFLGTLTLNGLNRNLDKAVNQVRDAEDPTYLMGIQFSLPLENGEAKAKRAQAKIRNKQAILELEQLQKDISHAVDAVIRESKMAYDSWSISLDIAELQKKKLLAEMKRFEQGRSNSDLIINFQADVLTSERRRIAAAAAFYGARDSFDLALGKLLTQYADVY
ncbi:MAG: outer membrane protein TolC [Candidatus Omnitrophota bacterium]|jgi:outer membrane protein TolC